MFGPVYPTEYRDIELAQAYFKQVMELWPNVRILEFRNCVITKASLLMLESAPPWIKTVKFQHCEFSNAEILLSTVDKIPNIAHLSVGYPIIYIPQPIAPGEGPLLSRMLNALEFDMGITVRSYPAHPGANTACARFLLTHIPFQDLEMLEISRIPHDASELFNDVLKRAGSRLRDLKLSFSSLRCQSDLSGLSYNPSDPFGIFDIYANIY